MDNVSCYCAYEVPFRGVSSENPSGHLLTAVRNSGEKQYFGKPLDSIFRYGCFEVTHNKLTLYGVLGLSNWEVLFVPCINHSLINKNEINSIRQLLSQTLSRTEPYFYRSLASDRPGCIGLGKIDCLLIQDRRERLYKFDPIHNIWKRSTSGLQLNFKKRWLYESKKLPHLPTRLLILTTDFEVYTFQICHMYQHHMKLSTASLLTSQELSVLRENIKNNLNIFINLLTARISHVRRSTGYLLANEYANRDLKKVLITEQTVNFDSHERSVNNFLINWNCFNEKTKMNQVNKVHDLPINLTPINSLTRLQAKWYHRLKGNYEIINNTEFAYCRTLPLEIPTLAFKISVLVFRDYFEGHRFPVLSFYYPNKVNSSINKNNYLYKYYSPYSLPVNTPLSLPPSSAAPPCSYDVWVLRSGNILTDIDISQLIQCNNDLPVTNQQKLFLKHIKLSFSDHLNELFKHKTSIKLKEQSSQQYLHELYTPLDEDDCGDLCTTTQNFTSSHLSNHHGNNSNNVNNVADVSSKSFEQNHIIPPLLETELYENDGHFDNWFTPKYNHIQQSWLQLKNLIQLSQIHVPNAEISNEFANTTEHNTTVVDDFQLLNNDKTTAVNNNLLYMKWDTLSTDSLSSERDKYPSITLRSKSNLRDHSITDRRLSTTSESHRFRFFNFHKNDANTKQKNNAMTTITTNNNKSSNSTSNLRNSIGQSLGRSYSYFHPLHKKKLDNIAFQFSPHRSDWLENLSSTNWLDFLLFILKQATQLTQSIYQYARKPVNGYNGTIILLSGPDSGRNWQPILMSLVQIMLSAENRTIHGFEDLIEQEWIRYGYPFVPDPMDWHDESVNSDYDGGVCFALFIDCVHQLLIQFPTEFAFTEDYLVLLLDSALSRGGGTPPFSIEFSCSCEAARHVKTKAMTHEQVIEKSNYFHDIGAWRSFHNWNDILTNDGCQLLPNWLYFWKYNSDPMKSSSDYAKLIQTVNKSSQILTPILSPLYYPRFWIHAWYRWNRCARLTNGGGYAFDAAYYRNLLGPINSKDKQQSIVTPRTSTSPYTGWLSDESIVNALNQCATSIPLDSTYKSLYDIANLWDNEFCYNSS
ncbi:Myotubularin-related protein [Schistosoma japonicum]|uniref:Myotubularin-related protein n=1 Tax=Schistosoma japonicum TaxID=6182 RepID=A0A4Z2D2C9_SCHJA|nr:Myotubularin-related protein [Schistosoma japonicum]TNN10664.1 Myotubularin-related protein [Schistosoma japonicum]